MPNTTFLRLIRILSIDLAKRRISAEKFHDLFNITLVIMGVKPAALVRKMSKAHQIALRTTFDLYVDNIKIPSQNTHQFTITWIAKRRPTLPLNSHIKIGKELGYLRPMDIFTDLQQYTRPIGLEITFIGKKTKVQLLTQKVPNATLQRDVLAYLNKYVVALRELAMPLHFRIENINIIQ